MIKMIESSGLTPDAVAKAANVPLEKIESGALTPTQAARITAICGGVIEYVPADRVGDWAAIVAAVQLADRPRQNRAALDQIRAILRERGLL